MKFEVDFGKQKDCWKRIFEYLVSRSFYFSTSPVVRGRKWTICLTYVHPGDCPRPTLPVEQSRIVASTCAPIPSCWPMEKKKNTKKNLKKERKIERKKEKRKPDPIKIFSNPGRTLERGLFADFSSRRGRTQSQGWIHFETIPRCHTRA